MKKRAFLFFGAAVVSLAIFILGLSKIVPGFGPVLPFSGTSTAVMIGLGVLTILDERERKPHPPRRLLKKGFYDFGMILTVVFGFLCLGWYKDVEGQTWKEIAITAAVVLDFGLMIYLIIRGIQAENRENKSAREEVSRSGRSASKREQEYEIACAKRLMRQGYRDLRFIPGTQDFGAVILADHPKGYTICFQCRFCSQRVDESAVREAAAAAQTYGADCGAVMTPASFTSKARELAERAHVVLLPCFDAHLDWIDRIEEFDAFMN